MTSSTVNARQHQRTVPPHARVHACARVHAYVCVRARARVCVSLSLSVLDGWPGFVPSLAVVFNRSWSGSMEPCLATVKRRISGRLAAAMIAVELYLKE